MKKHLTCIVCPMGCDITVTMENKNIIEISGNTCPRGADYAKNECTNPQRTVTSTIMCENGKIVPVKTSKPIPKDKIFDCMKIINGTVLKTPLKIGDIAFHDVFGADITVTANMN